MNRNDGGTTPGELARTNVVATDNAIDPGDYWRRTSTKTDNYQFTGENSEKKVVASTAMPSDAAKTYTVKDKDSLWSIASKMVNDSDCKNKTDKFKLDVVKGLVEKNKDSIKGLEANPDKIKGGWTLKVDSVEELAKLGHGKVLNTTYKPPSERNKDKEGTPRDTNTPPEHRKHKGEQRADYGDQYGNQNYGDQRHMRHKPMDMGPAGDIMGMIGMMAGSAILGNVLGRGHDHHHRHHRPYFDDYRHGGTGYYDGGYYGQHRQPNYQHYRPHQFQPYREPVEYSHYGHPQHNYVVPLNQAHQFRIPQIQHQHQQNQTWNQLYQQRLQQQQQQQHWRQYRA